MTPSSNLTTWYGDVPFCGYVHNLVAILHCVSKKRPTFDLLWVNLHIYGLIATIFGKNVAKKVGNQNMYFIFPPHVTNASALPGESGNPEVASFHLNAACLLPKKTKHTVVKIQKYHLVRAEPTFTVKMIDWMHHTGPRKGA